MKLRLIKKILPAVAIVMTAVTLTGCGFSFSSTVTKSETDANGNTVTTTTTTTNDNGKVTTTTTETATDATTGSSVGEADPELITATISFTNHTPFEFSEIYCACSTNENWDDNLLDDGVTLKENETLTLHDGLTYSENNLFWDLKIVHSGDQSVEVRDLDFSEAADAENVTIVVEYDEEADTYTVNVE